MINSTEDDIVSGIANKLRTLQYYPATNSNIQLQGNNVSLGGKPNTMIVSAVPGNPEGILNSVSVGYTKINMREFETKWGGVRVPIDDYPTAESLVKAIRESVGVSLSTADIVFPGPMSNAELTTSTTKVITAQATSVKYTGAFTLSFFQRPSARLTYEYVITSTRSSLDVVLTTDEKVLPSLFTVYINGVKYPVTNRLYSWNSYNYGILSVTGSFPAGTYTIDVQAYSPVGLGMVSGANPISQNWIPPSKLIEYTENGYQSTKLAVIGNSSSVSVTILPDCLQKNTLPINLTWAFGLARLTAIPEDLLKGVPVSLMQYAFSTSGISAIPEKLFSQGTVLSGYMNYAFSNCPSLTKMPSTPLPVNTVVSLKGLFSGTPLTGVTDNYFQNCGSCTDISYLFYQTKLAAVNNKTLVGLSNVTNASYLFTYCPFTSIPFDLLAPITLVTDLSYAFMYTGIISIPAGLMDPVVAVKDISGLFSTCTSLKTIPDKLFVSNTALTNCYMLFYQDYYVESLPDDLFWGMSKVTDISFMLCYTGMRGPALANGGWTLKATAFKDFTSVVSANRVSLQAPWTKIEVGSFDAFINTTVIANFFGGASWSAGGSPIPDIPEDLFRTMGKLNNAANVFAFSLIDSIPEKLLQNCPSKNIQSISGMFMNCDNVKTVPVDFLKGQTALTDISWLFGNYGSVNNPTVGGLTSVPATIFRDCGNVTNITGLFAGSQLTSLPTGIFSALTKVTTIQQVCFRMDKLQSIPDDLFATMPNVTEFESAFAYCTQIQTVPDALFKYQTKVTRAANTFLGCSSLVTIPSTLFTTCTNLSYAANIFKDCIALTKLPAGLFINSYPGMSMSGAFSGCTSLNRVEGVWYRLAAATSSMSLDSCFQGCDALTFAPGSMPYTSNTTWANTLGMLTIYTPVLKSAGFRGTVDDIDAAFVPFTPGIKPIATSLGGASNTVNTYITGSAQTFMTKIGYTQSQLNTVFGLGTRVVW